MLTEDPAISDRALYQSVLAAIAECRSTRSAVASQLWRDESALRHPLLILERAVFIRRDADLLLSKRPLIRIAEVSRRISALGGTAASSDERLSLHSQAFRSASRKTLASAPQSPRSAPA